MFYNYLGDFVLLSRKDLQKVGLVTRSSVKIFEELLQSLKKDEKVLYIFVWFFCNILHHSFPNPN